MEDFSNDDRDLIRNRIQQILSKEDLTVSDIESIKIVIPPHKNGLGMDTTRLYNTMSPEKKYAHSIVVKSARDGIGGRETCQQDVIVEAVRNLTDGRWKAALEDRAHSRSKSGRNIYITLTIRLKPMKVIKRLTPELMQDLNTLLSCVTKHPID